MMSTSYAIDTLQSWVDDAWDDVNFVPEGMEPDPHAPSYEDVAHDVAEGFFMFHWRDLSPEAQRYFAQHPEYVYTIQRVKKALA